MSGYGDQYEGTPRTPRPEFPQVTPSVPQEVDTGFTRVPVALREMLTIAERMLEAARRERLDPIEWHLHPIDWAEINAMAPVNPNMMRHVTPVPLGSSGPSDVLCFHGLPVRPRDDRGLRGRFRLVVQ